MRSERKNKFICIFSEPQGRKACKAGLKRKAENGKLSSWLGVRIERRETRDERRETTAAIKPSAETACRLCRGEAVKSRACTGQRRKARDFLFFWLLAVSLLGRLEKLGSLAMRQSLNSLNSLNSLKWLIAKKYCRELQKCAEKIEVVSGS